MFTIFSIMDNENKVLTVHLIHSLPLAMSAIQVFVKDKMAVVAHLVHMDEVLQSFDAKLRIDPTNSQFPWRAMVIKDNDGDWGICAATWSGLWAGEPGIPGTRGRTWKKSPGTPGVSGNPGYFEFVFKSLRTGAVKKLSWSDGELYYTCLFHEKMQVEIENGYLLLHPGTEDAVQKVALSFVISMLYLMVQPTPGDVDTAIEEYKRDKNSGKGKKYLFGIPKYLDAESVNFFVYCGWNKRT
jgi:hypothetical protein